MSDERVDVGTLQAEAPRLLARLRQRGRPIEIIAEDGSPAGVLVAPEYLSRLRELAGFAAAVSEGLADSDAGRVVDDAAMTGLLDAELGRTETRSDPDSPAAMRLRWTLRGRHDLLAIGRRLAARDRGVARLAVDQLHEWARYAAGTPGAGRVVPELGRPDVLELICGDYRILYRQTSQDALDILMLVDAWPFPSAAGAL